MKDTVVFVIYRAWALRIFLMAYHEMKQRGHVVAFTIITTPSAEFDHKDIPSDVTVVVHEGADDAAIRTSLRVVHATIAFFYGWSWIVSRETLAQCLCVCLHPSLLPKYRGGSPLQHQIIVGEETGGVTVFRMGEGVDDGDIYAQAEMSLLGSLQEIFDRMVAIGGDMTIAMLSDHMNGSLLFCPQVDLQLHPPLRRRRLSDSELTEMMLKQMKCVDLYNFVRALTNPYPNASIVFPDGVLRITGVKVVVGDCKMLPTLSVNIPFRQQCSTPPLYLRCSDGCIEITQSEFES